MATQTTQRTVKRGYRSIQIHNRRLLARHAPGSQSTMRTAKGMGEVAGMRSVPRRGKDPWESMAETRRIELARSRRLTRLNPARGEATEN